MGSNDRKAVIYARVSSKEQEKEGFSIQAQLKLLRNYAEQNRFVIVQEFIDVETAKQSGRANFTKMISCLTRDPGSTVIFVEKTDRLYRNLKDWVTLDELGVDTHFVKDNFILSKESRSSEKFMHGIKVLMAKNYIDNLSEEARKGMLEKAEEGIWPSSAPIGYTNVSSNGKRVIEPDLATSTIVKRLFEKYATGDHSLDALAKIAQADGLAFKRNRGGIRKATLHRMLQNPIYTGDFLWRGKSYKGVHVPLISRELFHRVQDVLHSRHLKNIHPIKHQFAFTGLISCGHCGCALVGEIKKQKYTYYHCTNNKGGCPKPYVRQELLETKFSDLLNRLTLNSQMIIWLKKALKESQNDELEYRKRAIESLESEYKLIQNRLDAAYADKLDGKIDTEFFDEKFGQWRKELTHIRRAIEEHEAANHNYIKEGVMLLELTQRARELFVNQKALEKRQLLNFVCSNCTWKDRELTVTLRQPFDLIADIASAQAEKAPEAGAYLDSSLIWRGRRDSNPRPPT